VCSDASGRTAPLSLLLSWRLNAYAGQNLVSGGPRRPTVDTFAEPQQLADDLTERGDNATATPVLKVIDRFSAWRFEAGDRLLERALVERRKQPGRPTFNMLSNLRPIFGSHTFGHDRLRSSSQST
jgi:hypothetical protein